MHPFQLRFVECDIRIVPGAFKTPNHISRDAIKHSVEVFAKVQRDRLVGLGLLDNLEVLGDVVHDELSANLHSSNYVGLMLLH